MCRTGSLTTLTSLGDKVYSQNKARGKWVFRDTNSNGLKPKDQAHHTEPPLNQFSFFLLGNR